MRFSWLVFILLFIIAFFYRFYGLFYNQPLWVDEFSTASQAKLALEHGLSIINNPSIHFETYNITTYFLVALFIKFFGQHEWVIRMPFAILGSFVPVILFLLAKYVYDVRTAFLASILTAFSYFEITWSRQARSYIIIQLLILLGFYFYFKLLRREKPVLNGVILMIIFILGILTHALFFIAVAAIALHFLIINRKQWIRVVRNKLFISGAILFVLTLVFSGLMSTLTDQYLKNFSVVNNFWYYHSFLWREYGLVTFLGITGLIIGYLKNRTTSLFIIFSLLQLIFVSFFLRPYVSRYVLVIFPFLYLGMAVFFQNLTEIIVLHYKIPYKKLLVNLVPIAIVIMILINGYKFVNKPKRFYSVNHDFREIALLNYTQVYDLIRTKGQLEKHQTAIIDTWNARTYWYLGADYQPVYIFRWIDEPQATNGLPHRTVFYVNGQGEKVMPKTESYLRLIGGLSDLKMAMQKYPRGFIFIDDSSLPADVRDFAEKKFKKELFLDHYPPDDNPYSIWPATLYSWGIQ